MQINRLSVAAVNAKTKPGLYADGLGLYLQVAKGGSKTWIFRYMLAGRPRKMGFGSVHTVSLKLARERAGEQRLKLLDADDPIELRKAERLEKLAASTTVLTFKEAAEAYIKAHRSGWKNIKHAAPMDGHAGDIRLSGVRRPRRVSCRCRSGHEGTRTDLDDEAGDGNAG